MKIRPVQPSHLGSENTFTGDVWRTPLHEGDAPGCLSVNLIHFSPGARTAWHSHDFGQILLVVEGAGLVQVRGESAQRLRAGDVVSAAPHEEHWHGADEEHFMAHYSLVESHPHGPAVTWGEHVTDEQYRQAFEDPED